VVVVEVVVVEEVEEVEEEVDLRVVEERAPSPWPLGTLWPVRLLPVSAIPPGTGGAAAEEGGAYYLSILLCFARSIRCNSYVRRATRLPVPASSLGERTVLPAPPLRVSPNDETKTRGGNKN